MTEKPKKLDGYNEIFSAMQRSLGIKENKHFAITNSSQISREGLFGKCLYYPVDVALSGGVKVAGDKNVIDSILQKTGFNKALAEAVVRARLKGKSLLFITSAKDGVDSVSKPLSTSLIQSIDGFATADYITPENGFYTIESNRYHESRVFVVDDGSVKNYSDYNKLSQLAEAVGSYLFTTSRIDNLIMRKYQPVARLSGLSEMAKDDPVLAERAIGQVAKVAKGMDTFEIAIFDKNDEVAILDAPINGLIDLYKEQRIKIATLSYIPVSHLFGDTPSGLNSNGKGDELVFKTFVNTIRSVYCEPAIMWAVSIIAQTTQAKLQLQEAGADFNNQNISFEWRDISEPSEKEKQETEKIKTDTMAQKVSAVLQMVEFQIINTDQARKMLEKYGVFNGD